MNRTLLNGCNAVITFAERPNIEFHISEKEIGRGASCVVYHAVGSDNTEHLLKEYYPKHLDLNRDSSGRILVPSIKMDAYEQGLARFRNSCECQKAIRLSNEGLKNFTCNVQGYYQANGTEYIDMTCFNGQTYDHVQEKSVYDLMLRIRTLAQVVGNYHKAGLLHLDIKPENIYVRPENETIEDVMLFDFDSVTPMSEVRTAKALSCTKTWAAPEQLLSEKRKSICPATDLFAIGEIIFVQLFGRHSNSAERRSFVTKYAYDHKAKIFKDMNPKVFPLLDDLLCHTICGVVGRRYQSAGDLIAKLDEIIKIANPESPYLKSSLPAVQDFFVGRENEIEEIHHKLSENRILFLNGIGGIGKSELAKHYAQERKDDYDAIIFAPYVSDVNILLQDDTAIPLYNFLQYPEETPEEYCARKLRKLQELCDERTLVIVDNLNREDDPDLNKLLDLGCKLLITTRIDFANYGYGKQILVSAISNSDDIYKLFAYYYGDEIPPKDLPIIQEIIGLLAGHTMAVELVAKQIEAEWATPREILRKLKRSGIRTIGTTDVDIGKDSHLSSDNAYGHIKSLFNLSAFKKRASERFTLNLLALMPYTGIDRKLFAKWITNNQEGQAASKLVQTSAIKGAAIGGIMGGVINGVSKDSIINVQEMSPKAAVNSLVKSGWVRLDPESKYISVHPLIAEVTLDNVDDTTAFEKFIKAYISHLRERNSSDIISPQDHCEDSKVNVHFLNLIERYNLTDPFFETLLNQIGGELFTIHQYDLALRACELATKIAIENNPAQSYAVTESISQMALIKASIGAERKDFAVIREAINTYLQAIENHKTFDENEYPDNYEEIATLYNYAGMAYEDLDEIDCARDMYGKGIAVYTERRVLNSDDYLSLGILYNNLGNTYSGSEALKYYLAAKDNHEKSGVLTRHAAITLYHLADTYSCSDKGVIDLNLAVDYGRKALDFFQSEYSEDLYMIGEAKYMLGKVYSQLTEPGYDQIAYTLLSEAKDIFIQFLPSEDSTILKVRELVENVCKQLGC